jgi:peptidoglycan/LPS O-acetylase OafA/YrhL
LIYRPDIDGLRAVAVSIVVFFHAFHDLLPGGFVGVDVFFVISGYLISSIILRDIERKRFSFVHFYAGRVRRLFPALFVVLVACAAIGWFELLPDEYEELGKHIVAGAGFVSNFVLWAGTGYFDTAASTKPLLHLWSLGIEEQFYLLWPAALVLAARWRIAALTLATAIAALSFLANVLGIHYGGIGHDSTATFFAPYTRFWELMAGALVAQLGGRYSLSSGQANWAGLLGIALIAVASLTFSSSLYYPGWSGLMPVAGACLIIAAGPGSWVNRYLACRPMVWIGLISYPLYLWHWPLLVFGAYVLIPFSDLDRLGAVALSVVLAAATYLFIERPIRFGSRRLAQAVVSCALMTSVASFGVFVWWQNGVPQCSLVALFQKDAGHTEPSIMALFHKDLGPDTMAAWEAASCSISSGPEKALTCPQRLDPSKKTLLLWGDSYAKHLIPGIQAHFGKEYNVVVLAASGCAPIVDTPYEAFRIDRELVSRLNPRIAQQCPEGNTDALAVAARLKPDRVVLALAWETYRWHLLERTITALRDLGIADIAVVGPPPVWQTTLQRVLYKAYSQSNSHALPTRLPAGPIGVSPRPFELDREVREWSLRRGLTYISLTDRLCNPEGCVALLGKEHHPVAFDASHLTVPASQFVVSTFPR